MKIVLIYLYLNGGSFFNENKLFKKDSFRFIFWGYLESGNWHRQLSKELVAML